MHFDYSLAGAGVGFLVGLTGVGGGSLMAPMLILLFGLSPAVAVGTDLWFATITAAVGGTIHHRFGSPDWLLVGRLALGSIPAAIGTLVWLAVFHNGRLDARLLTPVLGTALVVVSVVMLIKPLLRTRMRLMRARLGLDLSTWQFVFTVIGGAMVGALVALTSVGAGALVAVLLVLLYPLRLDARSIVGTDIVHAVPLTLVAAIGHLWLGNVHLLVLASLLLGSVPGIALGSLVAGKVNNTLVRYALAAMLALSAFKMLAG